MRKIANFDYEVAIVGASVTGASLAYALGRAGVKVALIDKQSFPRRKPCGEGLSALARPHLKELGLLETVDAIAQRKLCYYLLDFRGITLPVPCIGRRHGNSVGIDRSLLDRAINHEAAKNPSVELMINERVMDICPESNLLVTEKRSMTARYIVIAAGINNPLKNKIKYSTGQDRYGISIHARLPEHKKLNRVDILLQKGIQIFVTPTSLDEINISALGTRDEIKKLSSLNMAPALELVSSKLGITVRAISEIQGAGPFGRQAEKRIIGNVILAGDSYESLDPIGGMGMTQAFMSANYLSQALVTICQLGGDPTEALNNYEDKLRKSVLPLKIFSNLVKFTLDSCLGRIAAPLTAQAQKAVIQAA